MLHEIYLYFLSDHSNDRYGQSKCPTVNTFKSTGYGSLYSETEYLNGLKTDNTITKWKARKADFMTGHLNRLL
jgi:hypothetical protein